LGERSRTASSAPPATDYCHVAVDDHSRLPTVAIHADQKSDSAIRALEQVWGRYLRAGVRIKRILTDNGSC
jgi:hypothetical protein